MTGLRQVLRQVQRAADSPLEAVRVLAGAGVLAPVRPDRLVAAAQALRRWGMSPAAALAVAAARSPDAVAVIDDGGPITFAELDRRSSAVARGLLDLGVREHDLVALLIRNSRQFVVALAAVSKVGGDLLYLNTGFGRTRLAQALDGERAADGEKVAVVIADEEFEQLVADAAPRVPCVLAWVDGVRDDVLTLDGLGAADPTPPPAPRHTSRHLILTSGTTGRPRRAARDAPDPVGGLELLVSLVGAIGLRARRTTLLASPMFHAWGLAQLVIALLLQSTLVLRRRFDAETTLALLGEHQVDALIGVPVMLQRILELPPQVRRRHPVPELRVVGLSGSAIPPRVAQRFMDDYGEVVHNLYGSTEVAYVSVATPRDLREAPGTAGRPLHGVTLRILDDAGVQVPPGVRGRIFAGSALTFAGYSGAQDPQRRGGLVATGDVGHLDARGRLTVEGRLDDMIVSGGENVYPREVENGLLAHPDVADAAVVGVPDARFGQALVAHVVLRDGAVATPQGLRRYLKRELAPYQVPREVVLRRSLPRNETGKLLRGELSGEGGDDG
jgi:acyl-CoA synthetase (AMP-forming)/AMP-acid ligase II